MSSSSTSVFKFLFSDKFKEYKKASEPLFATPQNIQQTLELLSVSETGIFEVAKNRFSKCYKFEDINYETESEEGQINIINFYRQFLNSLDYDFKIVIVNKPKNMPELRKNVLFQEKNNKFDTYRNFMNEHIENKINEGRDGVEQSKYLVISLNEKSFEEAKMLFKTIESNVEREFNKLKSKIGALNGNERLTLIRNIYRMGEENVEDINLKDYIDNYRDPKNDIINSVKTTYSDTDFVMDNMFCKSSFIKSYPNKLSVGFFNSLTSLPIYSITAVDIVPIPKEIATRKLQNVAMGIEGKIVKQGRKRVKNKDFASEISHKVLNEKAEIEEQSDDVTKNDEKVFYVSTNIITMARSKEELTSINRTVNALCNANGCKLEVQYQRQREAFNTALPLGVRQVNTMRSMITSSVSALMPFHVQELFYKGENIYYGVNQVSKNIILGNRKKLANGNGFVFGKSGFGKSYKVKEEIESVFLNTDDDIIIVDPQHEYFDMADLMDGAVVNLSNRAKFYVNPLDIDLTILDNKDANGDVIDDEGILADKVEFVLGMCEQCIGSENINAHHQSVISRTTQALYKELAKKPLKDREQVLLSDLNELLRKQPEPEGEDVAFSLELYISGGLDLFNHQTTVDVDNRLIVYGIKELGTKLRPMAMLIMLENIKTRIMKNFEKGIATWLYIDEIHVLMKDPFTIEYLENLWKIIRKFKGLCTGITQNVIDITKNDRSRTMLSNSEFIVLLKQGLKDTDALLETVEGINEEQLKDYVEVAVAGTGLLKHGDIIIPFDSRMDKENDLYWLFSTNPHEQEERKKRLNLSSERKY